MGEQEKDEKGRLENQGFEKIRVRRDMNERSDNINYTMMIIENTPTRVYLFIEFL